MPVELQTTADDDDFVIRLSGVVDESSSWPKEKARLRQRVILDCSSLERVNSLGLQNWANWMKTYSADQQFQFSGCPPRIMETLFNVEGFLPKLFTIESFLLTYECPTCGHAETVMIERGKHFVETAGDPPVRISLPTDLNCGKCRGRMQPDDFETRRLKTLEKMF